MTTLEYTVDDSPAPATEPTPPAADIVHVTDHCVDAQSRVLSQYLEKPRLAELLCIFVDRVQECEDVGWDLHTLRTIDTAEGTQLDVIGRIVGQPRFGLPDESYRVFIRARIQANRSSGSVPDLYRVLDAAFSFADPIPATVESKPPASVLVRVSVECSIGGIRFDEILNELLQDSVMAGVRLILSVPYDELEDSLVLGHNAGASNLFAGLGSAAGSIAGGARLGRALDEGT